MAEAGWYPLPSDPTKLMYYDGTQWVGTPVAAPSSPPAVAEPQGTGGVVEDLIDRAKAFASDEKNQGTAMAVAGGAAIADGVVGIGRRKGIGSAIVSVFFGIIFALIGWNITGFFLSSLSVPDKYGYEQETHAEVVFLEYDHDDFCHPYVLLEGEEVALRMPAKVEPCPVAVGQEVGVFYTPGSPESARLSTASADEMKKSIGGMVSLFRWAFVGAGILVAVGGVFQLLMKLGVIAGGSVLMVLGMRKRKAAQEARDREGEVPDAG